MREAQAGSNRACVPKVVYKTYMESSGPVHEPEGIHTVQKVAWTPFFLNMVYGMENTELRETFARWYAH